MGRTPDMSLLLDAIPIHLSMPSPEGTLCRSDGSLAALIAAELQGRTALPRVRLRTFFTCAECAECYAGRDFEALRPGDPVFQARLCCQRAASLEQINTDQTARGKNI